MTKRFVRLFMNFCLAIIVFVELPGSAIASAAEKNTPLQYPVRPIRFVVPYAPGGNADFIGREIANRMNQSLNVPVVVDNRAGAGSLLGIGLVAGASPDGYSLVLATSAGLSISPALGVKIPFDPAKSFEAVGMVAYTPFALVVNASLPVASVGELIAFIKDRPGKISYGSPGFGTPNHLGGEMLKSMTGINMVHVAYKGASPAMLDVLTGEIQMMFAGVPQAIQQAKTGKVKIIAVGHSKRLQALPDVPAVAETVSGFNNSSWQGILAPAETPKPIVSRLNTSLNKILSSRDLVQRFNSVGIEIETMSSEEFSTFIRSERARWHKVIEAANISVEKMR